ncbi:FimD/PapC N-terminal domain-containing protein [Serratia ureilytica]
MALKKKRPKVTLWRDNQCAGHSRHQRRNGFPIASATVKQITIPQAWMKYSDPDWTPPEQWDDGIPGAAGLQSQRPNR